MKSAKVKRLCRKEKKNRKKKKTEVREFDAAVLYFSCIVSF